MLFIYIVISLSAVPMIAVEYDYLHITVIRLDSGLIDKVFEREDVLPYIY